MDNQGNEKKRKLNTEAEGDMDPVPVPVPNPTSTSTPTTPVEDTPLPKPKRQKSRVLSTEDVGKTRWLALKTVHYTNFKGETKQWDMAARTTKDESSNNKPDAAIIIPILISTKSKTLDTVLVKQYRPPVQQYTLEFPAGLIDPGETPEQAAIREFKEETGYTGTVDERFQRQLLCMTPGLTNETSCMVVLNVDMDDPINDNPKQELDHDEDIDLKRMPLLEVLKFLQEGEEKEEKKKNQTKNMMKNDDDGGGDDDNVVEGGEEKNETKDSSENKGEPVLAVNSGSLPVALLYSCAIGIELGLKYGDSK